MTSVVTALSSYKLKHKIGDDNDATRQRILSVFYVGVCLLSVTTVALAFMIYVDVTQTRTLKKWIANRGANMDLQRTIDACDLDSLLG